MSSSSREFKDPKPNPAVANKFLNDYLINGTEFWDSLLGQAETTFKWGYELVSSAFDKVYSFVSSAFSVFTNSARHTEEKKYEKSEDTSNKAKRNDESYVLKKRFVDKFGSHAGCIEIAIELGQRATEIQKNYKSKPKFLQLKGYSEAAMCLHAVRSYVLESAFDSSEDGKKAYTAELDKRKLDLNEKKTACTNLQRQMADLGDEQSSLAIYKRSAKIVPNIAGKIEISGLHVEFEKKQEAYLAALTQLAFLGDENAIKEASALNLFNMYELVPKNTHFTDLIKDTPVCLQRKFHRRYVEEMIIQPKTTMPYASWNAFEIIAIEDERRALERQAKEKAERERLEREKAERERLEREKAERERLEREKAERERLEREKAERERLEREKAERERLEREKAERERLEREKAEQAERERQQTEQRESKKAAEGTGTLAIHAALAKSASNPSEAVQTSLQTSIQPLAEDKSKASKASESKHANTTEAKEDEQHAPLTKQQRRRAAREKGRNKGKHPAQIENPADTAEADKTQRLTMS